MLSPAEHAGTRMLTAKDIMFHCIYPQPIDDDYKMKGVWSHFTLFETSKKFQEVLRGSSPLTPTTKKGAKYRKDLCQNAGHDKIDVRLLQLGSHRHRGQSK